MDKLVVTADGSHTIYIEKLNEHYHSVNGAVQESMHIFINYGFNFCKADPVHIFEAGFGTGLNALLTAIRSMEGKRKVFYTSIEKYPLEKKTLKSLNHYLFAGSEGERTADAIFSAPEGVMTPVFNNFSIRKIEDDLLSCNDTGNYDLIYFDAFGPDKQPEMWTQAVFEKIAAMTVPGGILVTYSAKGQVKRNLRSSGFEPELLPGPPGKRQVIRAVKI
jgi:tRNA U34 5-methylaminomethyl-2-thiouridine-forming methyltransferase MnmC